MLLSALPARAQGDLDSRLHGAHQAAYNLDREKALAMARAAVADSPRSSRAHRTLASILWLQALFHRGAVTVDHYMGGITSSSLDLPEPPEAIVREFQTALDEAIRLAESALDERPDDTDALYDLGAAHGLQASWTASVEGRTRGAFGSARRAFNAQERVLEMEPDRAGAGAIVGTYRYVVGGLGMASRFVAYLAGFGGDKARGIALLEAAAAPESESRFEARTALVLIYSREGRHADAYELLTAMSAEFPDNRLLVLERGSAAIRADRAHDAERILTPGIARLADDRRPRMPGEEALWHYKLGLAQLRLDRRPAAAGSLQTALARGPEPWMRGRIELALGKLEDLDGRRGAAIARYRRARDLARMASDEPTAEEAARLLREPFVLSRRFPPLRAPAGLPHFGAPDHV